MSRIVALASLLALLVACGGSMSGRDADREGAGSSDVSTMDSVETRDGLDILTEDDAQDAGRFFDSSIADASPDEAGGELDAMADMSPEDSASHDGAASDVVAPDTSSPDLGDVAAEDGGVDVSQGIACATIADCELALPDHSPCQALHCVDGFCVVDVIEPCCESDSDCFDWDACTEDLCDPLSHDCSHPAVGDPLCCSGPWMLQESFEDDLGARWTVVGEDGAGGDEMGPAHDRAFWHTSRRRATDGERALVFDEPTSGSYGTGYHEWGEVTGPAIAIPAGAERPTFRFDLYLDTEWRNFTQDWADPSPLVYDVLTLALDDGERRVEIWSSMSVDVQGSTCDVTGCGWRTFAVDIASFRGRSVRPVFRFDSGDHVDNDYAGPAIDVVGLELACGAPPECLGSVDCDDQDACTDDICRDNVCVYEKNYLPGCCYDFELASWSFDPFSLSNFSVEPESTGVRWHVSDSRAHSPQASLRFGDVVGASYDEPGQPVAGLALSPSVGLSTWPNQTLDLWLWLDVEPFDPVEPFRDRFEIIAKVPGDGGAGREVILWDRSALDPLQLRTWVPVRVSLEDVLGETIQVGLRFSSGDAEGNSGEGVYVDDVTVTWRCP